MFLKPNTQCLGLRNVLIFFTDETDEYFCLLISRHLVDATSHVAAFWGNQKDAVGVNSRHATSVVATSFVKSVLISQFVHFFPMLYFALKAERRKPSFVFLTGLA